MLLFNKISSFLLILVFTSMPTFAMDQLEWSYSGATGPSHWGELSDDYITCFTGELQSPIDIKDTSLTTITPIKFFYYKSPRMALKNTGHTVEINYGEGSDIIIGKTEYKLKQIHLHTPSEHTINGEQKPMEIHFVHISSSHRAVVIALFAEEGEENEYFKPIIKYLPKNKNDFDIFYHKNLSPKNLVPEKKEYYKYTGSLTSPPCTEGVSWFLIKEPITLSGEQIDAINKVVGTNNRPIQPTNNRNIKESMEEVPEPITPPVEETPAEVEEGEENTVEESTEAEAPAEDAVAEEPATGADSTTEESSTEEVVEEPTEEAVEAPTEGEDSTTEESSTEEVVEEPEEEAVAEELEEPVETAEEEVLDEVVIEEEIEVEENIVEDIDIEVEEDIEIEELG